MVISARFDNRKALSIIKEEEQSSDVYVEEEVQSSFEETIY